MLGKNIFVVIFVLLSIAIVFTIAHEHQKTSYDAIEKDQELYMIIGFCRKNCPIECKPIIPADTDQTYYICPKDEKPKKSKKTKKAKKIHSYDEVSDANLLKSTFIPLILSLLFL